MSLEDYTQRFIDAAFWMPYIEAVCARHRLSTGEICAGKPGSNPVFLVNEQFVVKFFTSFFNGRESSQVELDAYRLLSHTSNLMIPELMVEGSLYPTDPDWHWHYIITHFLPGQSFEDAQARIPYENRAIIAHRWVSW